jgi:ABC-type lipoprotein export system ATPase subunit
LTLEQDTPSITIGGGFTKTGEREPVRELYVQSGDVVALVGPTGSGKSLLLSDIEQMAEADTPSGRMISMDVHRDGCADDADQGRPVALLSQTMNFVIDMRVGDFLELHASSQGWTDNDVVDRVISLTNSLAGEPIARGTNMTVLSGGQSRALMIADMAIISDAPVVLIDEIENAGIDRLHALDLLSAQGKVIMFASHDPLIILRADRRVVMRNGGMVQVISTRQEERVLLRKLTAWDRQVTALREYLRSGLSVKDIKLEI